MQTTHSLVLFEPRSQDGVPRIHKDTCPTLNTAQGGQRQPCVALPLKQQPFCKSSRPSFKGDSETYIDCKVANTLNTFDVGDKRANELIVEKLPVYCVQGNCIDRSDTAGCNGKGWREGTSFTLNTIDRPAVCFSQKAYDKYKEEQVSTTLTASGGCYGGGSETLLIDKEKCICLKDDVTPHENTNGIAFTLAARDYKGPHVICAPTERKYIVRRLTPTECARLQGFADGWGIPDYKEDFTDEEYLFWLEVRNTYADVNGRKVKEYTKPQMVTWYNKLHSDSSEYKMWGNGIALPPTLYCMQGICDVMGFTPLNYHIPN